jgi:hypothetical protein
VTRLGSASPSSLFLDGPRRDDADKVIAPEPDLQEQGHEEQAVCRGRRRLGRVKHGTRDDQRAEGEEPGTGAADDGDDHVVDVVRRPVRDAAEVHGGQPARTDEDDRDDGGEADRLEP